MMRWDVINHLIKKYGYKSYLEIGYYKGWSFDRIECPNKIAVDPNPCKTVEQQNWLGGYAIWQKERGAEPVYYGDEFGHIVKSTSDDFFKVMKPEDRWDIIFIDGLHESQQVNKDIINALEHLNPGGTIVMHDCNPPTKLHITGTPNGEWTGDVYKSFITFSSNHMRETYVVDTDYGVGVIRDVSPIRANPEWIIKEQRHLLPDHNATTEEVIANFTHTILYDYPWKDFEAKRKEWLGLITPEEFLEKEKINHE